MANRKVRLGPVPPRPPPKPLTPAQERVRARFVERAQEQARPLLFEAPLEDHIATMSFATVCVATTSHVGPGDMWQYRPPVTPRELADQTHSEDCTYRRALHGRADPCEHGFPLCPFCHRCTCGQGGASWDEYHLEEE